MSTPAARSAASLLLATAAVAFAATTAAAPADAGAHVCPDIPGVPETVWTGAVDDQWETAGNWSPAVVPGGSDTASGYACLPPGAGTVRLLQGEERSLVAMYVRNGGDVVLEEGSKLFVRGDQASQPSVVEPASTLTVEGATFGGEGRLVLAGELTWHSNPAPGTATLTTRECASHPTEVLPYADAEPCDGPDGGHLDGDGGLLDVLETGRVLVDGRGVNLRDGYRLRVTGRMVVSGEGYIAADRGTSTELRPPIGGDGAGTLVFENDGGYYEGFTRFGETTLSTFVNEGSIRKAGGSGSSLITADYSQPGGKVRVDKGTLLLPTGTAAAADVRGGTTYGTGTCPTTGGSLGCEAVVDGQDDQNADLRVPAIDRDRARVTVQELAEGPLKRDIGRAVKVHAGDLDATRSRSAVLTFRYDASLLAGAGWEDVRLHRKHGAGPYELVRRCAQGRIPKGEAACVVPGASRTTPAGDVVLTVKATETSRWICRKPKRPL
jgi:hypothetical protein